MLQRIQTLYYILCITLWGSFFTGISILTFEDTSLKTTENLTLYGYEKSQILKGKSQLIAVNPQPFYLISGVVIALLYIAMMRYKSPKKQLGIARFVMLLNGLLLLVFVGWSTYLFSSASENTSNSVGVGYYVLCLTLPFSFFAYRGVLRDKMLLDSIDRLR